LYINRLLYEHIIYILNKLLFVKLGFSKLQFSEVQFYHERTQNILFVLVRDFSCGSWQNSSFVAIKNLNHALVEHGFGDFSETGDVRADDKIAGFAEFACSAVHIVENARHDVFKFRVYFFK